MNTQNFNQTGGFPLETDTLDEIQNAYSIFNALGAISGDKTIIRGCTQNGNTISDGQVYVNNELFEFRGGTLQSRVVIGQEIVSKPFENGENKEVLYKRFITFGTGSGSMAWSDFKRTPSILELQKALVPVGMISMWSGAINAIPSGWVLCNGGNGTPNLSGKFIVGYQSNDADYNSIGKTGGAKAVTLTESQMPSHNHTGNTNSAGQHNHTGNTNTAGQHSHSVPNENGVNGGSGVHFRIEGNNRNRQPGRMAGSHYHTFTTNNDGNHSHSFTTAAKGGNQAHENRPPYFTMAYIMFKG